MGSPAKVLVVDDDKVVLRAVSEILQREGYIVIAIDDAVEGLAAAKDPSIDVAVLDIKMPNLSGLDLLRAVKQARPEFYAIHSSRSRVPPSEEGSTRKEFKNFSIRQ